MRTDNKHDDAGIAVATVAVAGRHRDAPPIAASRSFVALVGVASFLAALLGILLMSTGSDLALFWPAAGIGAGFLAVAARRALVPAAAALFAGNAAANLVTDHALTATLAFAVANTAQAVIAATLIAVAVGWPPRLDRIGRIVAFLLAAFAAAGIGGTVALLGLGVAGHGAGHAWERWTQWTIAHATGIVAVAPAVFAWGYRDKRRRGWRRYAEGAAVLGLTGLAVACVFSDRQPVDAVLATVTAASVLFAAVVSMTSRAPARLATVAPAVLAILVMSFTAAGHGPFAAAPGSAISAFAAPLFVLTMAVTTLILLALFEAHRRSETRLRLSEERLQLAQDAGGIGVWDWDVDADRATCTASYFALFGRAGGKDGTQGFRDLMDLVYADDRAVVSSALALALTSGRYACEYRTQWPSGEIRWLSSRGRCIRDRSGRPARLIGITYDITARRDAEQALRRSEERFQQIAEVIDDVIYIEDRPNGQTALVSYISPAYRRLWGGAPERLSTNADDWLTIVHPDDRDRVVDNLAAWAGDGAYEHDYRIIRADGEVRWIRDRCFPVPPEVGRPLRIIGVCSDITTLKRAQAALARSEQRSRSQLAILAAIYETAPLGLAVIDREYRYQRINARLAEMNGVSAEDHIGRTIREMVPHVADVAEAVADRVFATGEMEQLEMSGRPPTAPGKERSWQTYWYPSTDDGGRIASVNIIVDEITERKAAEAQRELLLRELNHRVKNTLAVVQSIAEQTAASAASPAAFNAILTARLAALSRTHSLLTRGGWQGASLAEVFELMLAAFRQPVTGAGATAEGRIHIAGPDVSIRADAAVTLAMAVHELATNAAKYGSLSTAAGRLDATWSLFAGNGHAARVDILWVERGGPEVGPPGRRGFGTRLIERGLASQFDADVALTFGERGVRCRISLPAERVLVA